MTFDLNDKNVATAMPENRSIFERDRSFFNSTKENKTDFDNGTASELNQQSMDTQPKSSSPYHPTSKQSDMEYGKSALKQF